jgi:hypothetical protein
MTLHTQITPNDDGSILDARTELPHTRKPESAYMTSSSSIYLRKLRDGLFPFHEGDEVTVKVDAKQKRVILEKSS